MATAKPNTQASRLKIAAMRSDFARRAQSIWLIRKQNQYESARLRGNRLCGCG
jgi:hypothetical protein